MMIDAQRLVFIHGMVSSGQGFKARLLRRHFPHILTPDFDGWLEERMAQLRPILPISRIGPSSVPALAG